MPVQGLVRLRKHQFGRQATFGNKVAATRAYPFTGVPENELNWTDPEIDTGHRIVVANPHREKPDLTASLDAPSLRYNDIPLMLAAFLGGEVVPSTVGGTGRQWPFELDSTAIGEPDPTTYEFGDDVLTDWFQLGDGFLESVEFVWPTGKGPATASMSWHFGSIASSGSTDSPDAPTVPTAALEVATDDAIVYGKDTLIRVADTVAGLAAGTITDALHTLTLRLSQEFDEKLWMDGDQTFDTDAVAGGMVTIEVEATYAKTTQTVGLGSESDDWMSDASVQRFIQIVSTSTVDAGTATPYSWTTTMPARYYTREESDEGGNSVIVLNAHANFEADDFDGAFESTVINTLTEAELGNTTS
jgi:hypothetical protein